MPLHLPQFLSRFARAEPAPLRPVQMERRDKPAPPPDEEDADVLSAIAVPPMPPSEGDDASNDDKDVVDIDSVGAIDIGGLLQRLRALFHDPRYQPPTPPAVALELMALSRKSEIDLDAAEKLFQKDPMLTARVLKVARSPLYGSARIPGIKDAIVRLGARRLHHVVLEAALELRVFRSTTWGHWMERVRLHSTAVAHIARHLAPRGDVDPDQAFIAGLMHDIGIAAAIGAVGDRHSDFGDLDADALAQALDVIHTEVGGVVADAWQMSSEVKLVIAGHHHVQLKKSPLLAVIVAAEAFAIDAGFAVGAKLDPFIDEDFADARRVLDIDDEKAASIAREVQQLLANV
ncbi:MAG TPA: HDOD domain-containing protein [Myxococcota bacterium]